MNIRLLLNLLLAHLIGDFALQTSKSCKHKRDKKWCYIYQVDVEALQCEYAGGESRWF